ncbi:MAG: peptide ABC transporter permease [Beijerinckiaceae bacterium]
MAYLSDERAADPAEQAALLLFRIGFAILCILLPVTAVFSRRATVIIAPIGAIVMICATLMMKGKSHGGPKISAMALSACGLASLFLFFWAGLSLLWTPYPWPAAERLARIGGTLLLAMGATAALPERMRVSNLYLLALGVGIAALAALADSLFKLGEPDPTNQDRAAVLISLLAWPAVAWLSIKQRSLPAMGIAGGVGALAISLQGPDILPALLVGAVMLGGAMTNLRGVAVAAAIAAVILVLAAPLIALGLSLFTEQSSEFGRTMQLWSDVIRADPSRLITGHGLETSLRNRIAQALDPSAPKSLLFEIWYELGVLGALGAAAVVATAMLGAAKISRRLGPFALGALGFAFALAVTGLGTSQNWFVAALATTVIAFAAVVRGEYRTQRPQPRPPRN